MEEAMKDMEPEFSDDQEDDYDPFKLPEELRRSMDFEITQGARENLGEKMLSGQDTEEKLDKMHDILMEHADTMARLAVELDPGKAPRAFEVMNGIIKNAMDAVNSKRDHELKTLRLMLDQQKFEHDRNSSDSSPQAAGDQVVAVMTTADLVRSFRKEMEAAPVAEPRETPSDK